VIVLFTPIWASLGSALNNQALGLSVSARFAEWLRDNGAGSVVNSAENWWYSHHQPPVGGRPLAEALPTQQRTGVRATGFHRDSTAHLTVPTSLVAVCPSALAGEGSWRPVAVSCKVSQPSTRRFSDRMRSTQASWMGSPG